MQKLPFLLKSILLLAVCLMASFTVNAQYFYENGIAYRMTDENWDKAVVVSDFYGGYSGDIVIPEIVSTVIWSNYEEYDLTVTVTGIDEEAFRDCTQLTSVELPNSIVSIGRNAFYGCSGMQTINLPPSLTSIGTTAFGYCTSLSSITIPNGVSNMDWNVFYCCTGLTSVSIPNSVTQLNGTFFGCTGLTTVKLPESLITLDGTFTGCTGLTSIVIPGSVGYIGLRTFENCTALESVVLPSSLTYLAEQAFFNCENLRNVTCLATTPPAMYTSNSECFDYSTYVSGLLYVPTASKEQYKSASWWKLFNNIQGLLTLNETSVSLERGSTLQLVATLAPGFNAPLGWQSSNTQVVTVTADGIIRAINLGEAVVYAIAGNEQVACQVTVVGGDFVLGDFDGDGLVGVNDVVILIDLILENAGDPALYDINGDGIVGIADVAAIIDLILG